jgi:hypothetical protein
MIDPKGHPRAFGANTMRRQTQMQLWIAVLSLLLASCVSRELTRINNEQAMPALEQDHLADFKLLNSPQYASLRGAAADETPGSDAWRRRAIANALATDYIRRKEGPMYRNRDASGATDGLPQTCLALSGGGLRALSFDAGVLHGLQQRGLYSKVDVLSAVSGGGFASYWLLGGMNRGGREAEILSGPDSPELTELRRHAGDLASMATMMSFLVRFVPPGHPAMADERPFARLLLYPPDEVAFLPTPPRKAYQKVLDHMLLGGTMPVTRRPGHMPPTNLEEQTQSGRVPIPVWLATAMPVSDTLCIGPGSASETDLRSRSLLYSAFEMGPTGLGSNTLGYLKRMRISPVTALAISGAAMGIPYNESCRTMQMIDASMRVENFPARTEPMALPAPERWPPPTNDPFVLTDGAIADNLGLFPLVRRLCSDIIVVDAGFDPYLTFDSYGYLKQQLAKLDIDMVIPALEEIAVKNRVPPDPNDHAHPCHNGICLIRPRKQCIHREHDAGCVASDELPNAIFDGEIRAIPIASRTSSDAQGPTWTFGERALRIRYVKLSLDAAHLEVYPTTVRALYAKDVPHPPAEGDICDSQQDTGACRFPHKPTSDLDFRGGKFEAYWDLGRCIMERDWDAAAQAKPAKACADSTWPTIAP